MGNVSSRPDEGAALYLRDQNRCQSPSDPNIPECADVEVVM